MPESEYQHNLSLQSPILLDRTYKQPKVDKMLAILSDANALNKDGVAVDIGCSRGFFSLALAPYFTRVVGLDIDSHALAMARAENTNDNVSFMEGDSMNLPFPDNSIDLIICNHVYEHVPNPTQLFSEIQRVLKNTGCCYLGAASRLTLIEPHYHLAFLSWLPKPLAHLYMRLTGKGDHYYEKLHTYWGIRQLISEFNVTDYTLKVVADPDKYHARDLLTENSLVTKIPMVLWRTFYALLPSYILILRKTEPTP